MPTKIKAAVLREVNKPLVIEELLLDDPRPDEVLIKVHAAGLCHSDLNSMEGKFPIKLPSVVGHEAAGIVIAVGDRVRTIAVGDHVIPLFSPECRECANCISGKTNVCLQFDPMGDHETRITTLTGEPVHRSTLGATATHALMPEIAVVKVRDDAPLNRIFYCGCGVTTGVGAAMWTAGVERDTKVIVFGVGGIGLNAIQGAKLAGARLIVAVDTNPGREEAARKFGATHFVNPQALNGDVVQHLVELTGGGADYCIECIGNVDVMRQAIESSNRCWGKTVIVGVAPFGTSVVLDPFSLIQGRTITGSAFGSAKGRTDVPKVVDWYMNGDINIDDLVTHTLALEDINEGYDLMRRGESIRSVIEF